ncbi:MAG: hypothetical protein ACFCUW_14300 [Kiloniellaceae bacterium]
MSPLLRKVGSILPIFLDRLTVRRDSGPIDSVENLARFVSTRAALIAQKTLYGYLKTRMGTRFPSMFENDDFVVSIDIAKLHVYAACLSDLALYAAVHGLPEAGIAPEQRRALALHCFAQGLADNAEGAAKVEAFSAAETQAAFERRLAFWNWDGGLRGVDIFSESPAALVRWAPIAPELKRHDREIVENSIKFKWQEIRRSFERRIDVAALAAEIGRHDRVPA